MLSHPLLPKLRQLKLSGMLLTLDTRAAQALERQLSPTEFLALLLDDELERRSQQSLARRLKLSGCDEHKTLARFDFTAAPGVNRPFIQDQQVDCQEFVQETSVSPTGPGGVQIGQQPLGAAGEDPQFPFQGFDGQGVGDMAFNAAIDIPP